MHFLRTHHTSITLRFRLCHAAGRCRHPASHISKFQRVPASASATDELRTIHMPSGVAMRAVGEPYLQVGPDEDRACAAAVQQRLHNFASGDVFREAFGLPHSASAPAAEQGTALQTERVSQRRTVCRLFRQRSPGRHSIAIVVCVHPAPQKYCGTKDVRPCLCTGCSPVH